MRNLIIIHKFRYYYKNSDNSTNSKSVAPKLIMWTEKFEPSQFTNKKGLQMWFSNSKYNYLITLIVSTKYIFSIILHVCNLTLPFSSICMMIQLLAYLVDHRRELYGRLRDAPPLLGNADHLEIQAHLKSRRKILKYNGGFPSAGLQQISLISTHSQTSMCVATSELYIYFTYSYYYSPKLLS